MSQCEELAQSAFSLANKEPFQDLTKAEFDKFCIQSPGIAKFIEYWRQPSSQVKLRKGSKWSDTSGPPILLPQEVLNSSRINVYMPPEASFVEWHRGTELHEAAVCNSPSRLFTHSPQNLNHLAQIAVGTGALGHGSFVQGHLSDRWLLCALATVATRPSMVEHLFCHTGQEHLGRFGVQFWEGASWEKVFFDDRIPCDPGNKVLFSSSSDKSEYWVALLEKAFAKRFGSYAVLTAGCMERWFGGQDNVLSALRMMTGGHVEKRLMFTVEEQWQCAQYISNALKLGVMSVLRRVKPSMFVPKDGIASGFVYGVVAITEVPETGKFLVKLRDAFGFRPTAQILVEADDLQAAKTADLKLEQDLELLDPHIRREMVHHYRHFHPRYFWIDLPSLMASFDIIYTAQCPSMLQHCRDRTTTSMKKLSTGKLGRRPLPFASFTAAAPLIPLAAFAQFSLLYYIQPTLLEITQTPAMESTWITVSQRCMQQIDAIPLAIGFVLVAHDWGSIQHAKRLKVIKSSDVIFAHWQLQRSVHVTERLALPSGKYILYAVMEDTTGGHYCSIGVAGVCGSVACWTGNEIQWEPPGQSVPDDDLAFAFGEFGLEHTEEERLVQIQESHEDVESFVTHALANRLHSLWEEAQVLEHRIAQNEGII